VSNGAAFVCQEGCAKPLGLSYYPVDFAIFVSMDSMDCKGTLVDLCKDAKISLWLLGLPQRLCFVCSLLLVILVVVVFVVVVVVDAVVCRVVSLVVSMSGRS
jgi:hypothetical protein